MKRRITLLVLLTMLTVLFLLGGCGGQDHSAQPSVDKALNPYTGSYFGKAMNGTAFELALAAKISGSTVNFAVAGPNTSGIFPATGTCSALGSFSVTVNAFNDGVAVKYVFVGTMRKAGLAIVGSGTWTSPTRGHGKWALNPLVNVANAGSWTLTQSHVSSRTLTWDSAYAALVTISGKTVLAIMLDKSSTPWPIDALITVNNPQNAVLGTPFNLSDVTMRWSTAPGENYYAKETAPRTLNFSLNQLRLGGKLTGKVTATLVPFNNSGTNTWQVKTQSITNVVVTRDWR